jgi:hypothetical protein
MNRGQIIKDIKSEVKRINKVIDQKIVRGVPYMKEARYHKILLARLFMVKRTSMLARSMRVVTSFMV